MKGNMRGRKETLRYLSVNKNGKLRRRYKKRVSRIGRCEKRYHNGKLNFN